jgi:hypothetical protein
MINLESGHSLNTTPSYNNNQIVDEPLTISPSFYYRKYEGSSFRGAFVLCSDKYAALDRFVIGCGILFA